MHIFLIILIIIATVVIYYHNSLVKRKNTVQQYWSDIDIVLKKRHNLIPNLVNTVKGYASHEQNIFTQVVEARAQALNASTVKGQRVAEDNLINSLTKLFALAENYPKLKADIAFRQLQVNLYEIEKDIELAREGYNIAVRENNIMIEAFPGNFIANFFKFKSATYFEIENSLERVLQNVSFDNKKEERKKNNDF